MKTKRTSWMDRLPKWLQNLIDKSILILLGIVILVIIVITVGPPKAPQTNYIADWDGVSQVVVSFDSVNKQFIVSYRDCGGGNKFVQRKPDEIKQNQPFRGNPCPDAQAK